MEPLDLPPEELDPEAQKKRRVLVMVGILFAFGAVLVCLCAVVAGAVYFLRASGTEGISLVPTQVTRSQPLPLTAREQQPANPQDNPGEILKRFDYDISDGWQTGTQQDDRVKVEKQVRGGKYTWQVEALQPANHNAHLASFPADLPEDGYQLSLEGRVVSGPANGMFGVVFHFTDTENYWQFLVNESGVAYLAALKDNRWIYPGDIRVENFALEKGQAQTLTIQVSPKEAHFFLNGQWIGSVDANDHQEDSLLDGTLGIAVDLANAGDRMVVEFDNFTISHPPAFGQ